MLAFPVILPTLDGPHPFQGLHGTPALPQPVSLAVVFVLTSAVMAGLGQAVARLFVRFRPLRAYRLDILGQHRRDRGVHRCCPSSTSPRSPGA